MTESVKLPVNELIPVVLTCWPWSVLAPVRLKLFMLTLVLAGYTDQAAGVRYGRPLRVLTVSVCVLTASVEMFCACSVPPIFMS